MPRKSVSAAHWPPRRGPTGSARRHTLKTRWWLHCGGAIAVPCCSGSPLPARWPRRFWSASGCRTRRRQRSFRRPSLRVKPNRLHPQSPRPMWLPKNPQPSRPRAGRAPLPPGGVHRCGGVHPGRRLAGLRTDGARCHCPRSPSQIVPSRLRHCRQRGPLE